MTYFLLLYDPDLCDWILDGLFHNVDEAERVGMSAAGYMIIEGRKICKHILEEEDE